MHKYDSDFYRYINAGSLKSARVVVPLVNDVFNPKSVLDVGCGQGAWLAIWEEAGISDISGLDGHYVDTDHILAKSAKFVPSDLSKPFSLGKKFDLVQSLEVAEHLPKSSAQVFVNTLVDHGDVVMFSAAQPGQGGEHHINEQSLEFWRAAFAKRNYVAVDLIRPQIQNSQLVMPWYRYNTLIFVSESRLAELGNDVRAAIVPPDQKIRRYGSPLWKLRCASFALLPHQTVTFLAQANSAMRAALNRG